MSFGLAEFEAETGEGAEAVIARADAALYESKSGGRNCVTAHALAGGGGGSEGDQGGYSQAGDTLRKLQTLDSKATRQRKTPGEDDQEESD
jgi:Flp pilus assembly protein TadD